MQQPDNLFKRQRHLVRVNVEWLGQALTLVERLNDDAFTRAPHRVSSHLRHILEFYQCFLDGLASMHVDYDARRREPALERSRAAAARRIRLLIERLNGEPKLRGDAAMFVRLEDATAEELNDPFVMSSVGRELQALSSHTVHHFAIIAVELRCMGIAVDESFGVAPSTLRYRAAAA